MEPGNNENIAGDTGRIENNEAVNKETGTGRRDSDNTGSPGARGTRTKRTRIGGSGDSEKTESPKLVDIDLPDGKKINEKVKKRKITKKENIPILNQEQLIIFLESLSEIISNRHGLEYWKLTHEEASQLSTPLFNIMSKSSKAAIMTEYADYIALSIACITIIIPRILTMLSEKNKHKKEVKEDEKKIREGFTEIKKHSSSNGTNDNYSVLESMPSYY